MRIVLVVVALSLLAGIAGEAAAATYAKKHKRYAKQPAAGKEHAARSARPDAYVERDANKLPFGSAIWWDQMQREGRLGGEMP